MPPMSDGMSGKGGSVVGNADHQSTAIFHNIVNPIRNSDPNWNRCGSRDHRRNVGQVPNGGQDF